MQPYPRSLDLAWPGHLHGTGCLSAQAVGTRFPTVVWRLCLGPVGGWVWVLLTPPVLAGVLGGCVWARCVVVPLVSAVCGVRGWASVSACFTDVCGFVGAPLAPLPFPVPACGVGVCAGPGSRLCPALRGWVVGVCFLRFGFFFFFFSPGFVVPVPPSPFFRAGLLALFFFFCFGVPFPRGPLLLAWCCRFLVGGPPVPLWGSCLRCLLGGGLAACGGVGGRFAAVGCFRAFSSSPLLFFGGGGACLFLPLPSLGFARTRLHSVLSSVLLSSVAFCVAAFRHHGSGGLCTRWVRRPFLLG